MQDAPMLMWLSDRCHGYQNKKQTRTARAEGLESRGSRCEGSGMLLVYSLRHIGRHSQQDPCIMDLVLLFGKADDAGPPFITLHHLSHGRSGMHSGNPIAGRCINCAFRLQQSLLRARRLNLRFISVTHTRDSPVPVHRGQRRRARRTDTDADAATPIRYQKSPWRPVQEDDPFAAKHKIDEDGRFPSIRRLGGPTTRTSSGRPHELPRTVDFDVLLQNRLRVAKEDLREVPLLAQLRKEAAAAGEKAESFEKIWRGFVQSISPNAGTFFDAAPLGRGGTKTAENIRTLQEALKKRGQSALDNRIRYLFYAHLTNARFTQSDIENQRILADLRYPSEWFPATRAKQRKIHLHVGPTNSGKTYRALQRLEQSTSGAYAGPLRLLAHEVYSRLNAKGKACSLITGEERRLATREQGAKDNQIFSCTVEMVPLNLNMDVIVIDEIQMIGSPERGWAWTQALLGAKATEVHLCGEERTVPLIRKICASVGEELEIHHYERLSPLEVADSSLKGSLKNLRKGDCVVSFSVMGIHALRRQIERVTGKKVATVYGSLPPETRAHQARLFNDPNNDYDYLVASDAVGMGLNLAIKRIVFEQTIKFDGYERKPLTVADLKQIAGRAGRYRVAGFEKNIKDDDSVAATTQETQILAASKGEPAPPLSSDTLTSAETISLIPAGASPSTTASADTESTGLVTTLEDFDFPLVQTAMNSTPPPLATAGIYPPASILERFAAYFPPSTPFSYILTRLQELAQMHSRFHLCDLRDQVWVADLIEPIQGLSVTDRLIICSAPASKSDRELWSTLMPAFARCIAHQASGDLMSIPEIPLEVLDEEISASREYLRALERLHKGIVCYLWLSFRFGGVLTTRAAATHAKGMVEARIEDVLSRFSFTEAERRKLVEKREKQVLESLEGGEAGVLVEENAEDGDVEQSSDDRPEMAEERFVGEEDLPFEDPAEADVFARENANQQDQQSHQTAADGIALHDSIANDVDQLLDPVAEERSLSATDTLHSDDFPLQPTTSPTHSRPQ